MTTARSFISASLFLFVAVSAPCSRGTSGDQRLTLQDCIGLALKYNLQIQVSQQRILGAQVKVYESRDTLYPSISCSSIDMEYNHDRNYMGRFH